MGNAKSEYVTAGVFSETIRFIELNRRWPLRDEILIDHDLTRFSFGITLADINDSNVINLIDTASGKWYTYPNRNRLVKELMMAVNTYR
jgi:hypothetical protein